ncbi:MAG: hypothetical protein MHMPM18_002827 [Marteilia pararefringens]
MKGIYKLFCATISKLIRNRRLIDIRVASWLLESEWSFDNISECFEIFGMIDQISENRINKIRYHMANEIFQISGLIRNLDLRFEDQNKLQDLLFDIEMPLNLHLAAMNIEPHFKFDFNKTLLEAYEKKIRERLYEIESDFEIKFGYAINFRSPVQIKNLLYEKLELHLDISKPIGSKRNFFPKYSTCEGRLMELRGTHEIIDIILEHRRHQEFRAVWEQTKVVSGRISCSNLNVQSIPKSFPFSSDSAEPISIRKCFQSKSNMSLLAVDFKQIELRILAELSQDSKLFEDMRNDDEDIFRKIATGMYQFLLYK